MTGRTEGTLNPSMMMVSREPPQGLTWMTTGRLEIANIVRAVLRHPLGKGCCILAGTIRSQAPTTMMGTKSIQMVILSDRLPHQNKRLFRIEMSRVEVSEAFPSHLAEHIVMESILIARGSRPLEGLALLESPWTWTTARRPHQSQILRRMHHPDQPVPNLASLLRPRLSQLEHRQNQRFRKGSMLYLSDGTTSSIRDRRTMHRHNRHHTNKITQDRLRDREWRLGCAR